MKCAQMQPVHSSFSRTRSTTFIVGTAILAVVDVVVVVAAAAAAVLVAACCRASRAEAATLMCSPLM